MTEAIRCMCLFLAVVAACFICGGLGIWLDGPTETDAAAAVALDLNDAINAARVASKE